MSFGRELKDFVGGFQSGWTLVTNAKRAKAYGEQTEAAKNKGKGLKDYVDSEVAKGESQPLPVTGNTLAAPKAVNAPDRSTAAVGEEEEANYRAGGRVRDMGPHGANYDLDERRLPRRSEYTDRRGALIVPPDDQPYYGGEDETFTPMGDRPSATEQVAAPQPTRRMGQRDTLPPPEDVARPGAREIVGDMPGRSRGVGGETSARDPGAHLPPGYTPRSEAAPAVGAVDVVGPNPGRGRAPYPSEGYRAGTEGGAYDDPGYTPPAVPAEGGPESPPMVRGTASAAPSNAKVVGAVVGARRAARATPAVGGAESSPSLVSAQEIKANNMTPDQVNELNQARQASQRMSISRGEDPNAHIQNRSLRVELDDAGDAVDAGVGFLSKIFGLGGSGAVPTPGNDGMSGYKRYAAGEGAADPKTVQAAERIVDPTGELSQARRVMLTLNATHKYYLEQGDPKKAAAAAASLLQYYNLQSRRLAGISVTALQNGDVPGGVKAATHAYNMTPDGQELTAKVGKNGKIAYQNEDIVTGKITSRGEATASQLLDQAMQMAGGGGAKYLAQAAGGRRAAAATGGRGGGGKKAAAVGAPSGLNAALAAVREAQAAVDSNPEDQAAKDALTAAVKVYRSVPLTGKNDTWAVEKREGMLAGATGGAKPASGTASGGGGGTKEERAAAQSAREMGELGKLSDRADSMEQAGIAINDQKKPEAVPATESGYRPEATAVETARRSLAPARENIDAQRANRSNSDFDIKPGDRVKLEEEVSTYFDDMDTGPLAGIAQPDKKTGQKVPQGISPGDINSLKSWSYDAAARSNMPVRSASQAIMAMTSMDPKNPVADPPFKVLPDGTVSLRDGTMKVKLSGDTLKQILLWRRRRVSELHAKGNQAAADAKTAAGTSQQRKEYWGGSSQGQSFGDRLTNEPTAEDTKQREGYAARRKNQWRDPEERKRLGIE